MKEELESGWLRRLLKRKSRLSPFVARLDAASEAFKVRLPISYIILRL
jgi:hypothetical protein